MPYPPADAAQIAFFAEHGWLVVEDAVAPGEIEEIGARCQVILEKKHKLAFDWAWEKGRSREEREFRIVQGMPSLVWPEIAQAPFRRWAVAFASALMGREVEFWYDQFLAKPPRDGAPTYWHLDEGYWAATSKTAASPAGSRSTTWTSATAACTSSSAATRAAC